MALPDKNAHGSVPHHWPLSHPFWMGSPFSVLFLQSVKRKISHSTSSRSSPVQTSCWTRYFARHSLAFAVVRNSAISIVQCLEKPLQHLHHQPVTHPLFFDLLFSCFVLPFISCIPEIITLPWKYLKNDEDSILLHERKSRQLPADRHK